MQRTRGFLVGVQQQLNSNYIEQTSDKYIIILGIYIKSTESNSCPSLRKDSAFYFVAEFGVKWSFN